MLVSIIICTRNRAAQLRQVLKSVASVTVPETLVAELIVVDNGSTDGTEEVVRTSALANMQVRYIREPLTGKGNAYNAGIAAAHGEILLFTDDDVRVPENWIEGMCTPILSGNAHFVQGGVRLAPNLARPWLTKQLCWSLACTEGMGDWAVGANMAFSREVLSKVPRFDPELGPGALGFEDEVLFFRQLLQAGYRAVPALEVAVEHHCDESRLLRSSFLNTARAQGRSLAYCEFHWRHRSWSSPRWELAKSVVKLAAFRLRFWRELYQEGMPIREEVFLLTRIHLYRQYVIERKKPRKYEKLGLVKLDPVIP